MDVDIIYGFENVKIEATARTPYVNLDKDNGLIELKGKSIPENAVQFYWHFNRWVSEYINQPQKQTTVNLAFTYLNSASLVVVSGLLRQLNGLIGIKSNIIINWLYESGDDEIKELGDFLCQDMHFKINLQEVERI